MGEVRDSSEAALGKFVCRMVKIGALQWLSSAEASKVIEHLKKWFERSADKGLKQRGVK